MLVKGARPRTNLSLPTLTISYASDAKTHGGFGLVGGGITIPYQASILGQTLPRVTFTNHYRRGEDITHSDETMCYAGL